MAFVFPSLPQWPMTSSDNARTFLIYHVSDYFVKKAAIQKGNV